METNEPSAPSALPPSNETSSSAALFNGSGTPGVEQSTAHAQAIQRASLDAVDQHLSESPRGRGKRGPDKRPRRPRVPLGEMGNGASEAFMEEPGPSPLSSLLPPDPPEFDEETAKAMVEFCLDCVEDFQSGLAKVVAEKEFPGDAQFAQDASKAARMSEKVREKTERGGLMCAKKYAVSTKWGPEVLFFGGLAAYGVQGKRQRNAIKAKGKEFRALHGASG